ncbi:MAG: glycosyltransferase family 4 protein [Eubacterium sp.]|jgi:glycosyltransferase involved in cell wall biosynthesis|nr:glycosyltransferase family 4 protein [Eubacterium sp.]
MNHLQEDMELLQDNLLEMQALWDLTEPKVSVRQAGVKYPFVLCKKAARKILRWMLRPYFQQQAAFNGAAVRAVGDLLRIQHQMLVREKTSRDILPESDAPRIIQIVAGLNYGDAVGNDVIAIKNALKAKGIVTEIYATTIHKKIPAGTAKYSYRLPELREDDIVIYHFASADPLAETVQKLTCIKVLRYHNVTPPEFFQKYDRTAAHSTRLGLKQMREMNQSFDYVMTVSEYNKKDLRGMGYRCPIFVVPILIQFSDYAKKPSPKIIKEYSDGVKNIIFVGRIAPNKKIEDVITAYDYYHKKADANTRLIIVGSHQEKSRYYSYLQSLIRRIKAENIIFTGHITFEEILGCYSVADAFLCMSEHEGFCVPLVEAMYFGVPVVAYAGTAVPETLDGCGVLLEHKAPEYVAKALGAVLQDEEKRSEIIKRENERLKNFAVDVVGEKMIGVLEKMAGKKDGHPLAAAHHKCY